jgi:hypothetical protein
LPMIPRCEWEPHDAAARLQRHSLVCRQHLSHLDQKRNDFFWFQLIGRMPQRLINGFCQRFFPSRSPVFSIRRHKPIACSGFDQCHQIVQRLFSTRGKPRPHRFSECIDIPPCNGHEGNAWVIGVLASASKSLRSLAQSAVAAWSFKVTARPHSAVVRPNRGGGYRLLLLERSLRRSEAETSYEIPSSFLLGRARAV